MLTEIQKDVFTALSEREEPTLFLHGCNAQGGMGAGVAKVVKAKFPQAYQEYKAACAPYKAAKNTSELLGQVFFSELVGTQPQLVVANAITQEWYGRQKRKYADAEAIREALRTTENLYGNYQLVSVRVGAGYGGLDWETEVKPIFENSSRHWTIYYL